MDDLVDRFAASHFTLNSISEPRRKSVVRALREFDVFLAAMPIEEASDQELRTWLVELLQTRQPNTVNWYLRMVTPFYGWLWQEHVISADQLLRIRSVKPPRGWNTKMPRPYTRAEILAMWESLDKRWPRLPPYTAARGHKLNRYRNGTTSYRRIRSHVARVQLECWIELALVCGMRRGEIYNLSVDDGHWDNAYIVVHGKRSDQNPKVRDVPYVESTRAVMREWYQIRGFLGIADSTLWISATGPDPLRPLPEDRMQQGMLKTVGHYDMHRLRHTCATQRLRAGMPIEQLQRFLGHADITMTQRYAELVRADVHKTAIETDEAFQRAIRHAA